MNTLYYQVATSEKFAEFDIDVTVPGTLPSGMPYTPSQLQQADRMYKVADGLSRDFQVTTGMYYRHLEYSNGHMQDMWSDPLMQPLTLAELKIILLNEPQEEVI